MITDLRLGDKVYGGQNSCEMSCRGYERIVKELSRGGGRALMRVLLEVLILGRNLRAKILLGVWRL